MAKKLSPVASFQSDSGSSVGSPSYVVPATASGFGPKDGPNLARTLSGAVRNQVLIGKDATKDPSDTCLVWALRNLVQPGDTITVLGILHRIINPMGYMSQANFSDFVGTNRVALEGEMSQKLVRFEKKFRMVADFCDSRGVYLDITITAGTPLKSVLVKEATKMKATHVLLDRHLRKDKKYYKENLQCEVVAFSDKNQAERVRESSISYLFENPELPQPRQSSSDSSTVPSSPKSSGASFTCDGNSCRSSDASILKGELIAETESSTKRREDMSLNCLPNGNRRSKDSGEISTASKEVSIASSSSHSRDNSFIDLFMLSSPDGIKPVWSSANQNGILPSPEQEGSVAHPAGFKAEPNPSPMIKSVPSPLVDPGCLKPSTESGLSATHSSDQQTSEVTQKNSSFAQPKRHLTPLSELIKAHERQPGTNHYKKWPDQGRPAKSHMPTRATKEEPSVLQGSVFESAADEHTEEKLMPTKLSNQEDGAGYLLRRHHTQAPPLCSVCRHTSLELGRSPRVYNWLEVKAATNDFAAENLIAEGGFSFVYKGIIQGHTVAIKKLKAVSLEGDTQFATEIEALSCAQHRNLVRLLGYGEGNNERALVYEYVCNGSLDQHISGHIGGVLEWAARYKIAVGAARGLRYLHEECRVGCIVHRDMRPNNILITHDYVPMVGDYGLAKLNANIDAAMETQNVGALGFLAPEYLECGQVTSKADVYSFGVVLLELITGRRAIDLQRPKGEISLVEWARQKLQCNRIHELVDQKVADSLDTLELDRMVKAALLCIKRDPQARPGMSQVLQILEGDAYEVPIESMQEFFPASSSTRKSHNLDDIHQPTERMQTLHTASRKVSAVPRSWRSWVRSS